MRCYQPSGQLHSREPFLQKDVKLGRNTPCPLASFLSDFLRLRKAGPEFSHRDQGRDPSEVFPDLGDTRLFSMQLHDKIEPQQVKHSRYTIFGHVFNENRLEMSKIQCIR